MKYRVFAIAAHPDDIEFGMGGTLILLKQAGCDIHYMNIANGSCGTTEYDTDEIVAIRLKEAQEATKYIGAVFHPPLVPDLEIYYNKETIAKLGSIVREVAPDILLVPSPEDYMEDHMNACRLAVSAAFNRGMRNFRVDPPREPVFNDVVVYHAQPHGNRDPFNRMVEPDFFVNITSVIEEKTEMLASHKSQKEWLDRSQGFDSYLITMKEHAKEVGELSDRFEFSEGWRKHNPTGFCASDSNPLAELLQSYFHARRND
ncbi:PIG-L deacetylase family protein [Bacteroidota bacterium]